MKKALALSATIVFALGSAAIALAQTPAAQNMGNSKMSGTVASDLVSVTATVTKVDQKTRMVTLKGEDGTVEEFQVSDEVKNLPQVKAGDILKVDYYESLAYTVKKPGAATPAIAVSEGMATAKPGQKPAGMGAREVTVTATIMVIDAMNNTVTLKGPGGNLFKVHAQHPERLAAVNVGDQVEITYSQALAVAVTKAPKKS